MKKTDQAIFIGGFITVCIIIGLFMKNKTEENKSVDYYTKNAPNVSGEVNVRDRYAPSKKKIDNLEERIKWLEDNTAKLIAIRKDFNTHSHDDVRNKKRTTDLQCPVCGVMATYRPECIDMYDKVGKNSQYNSSYRQQICESCGNVFVVKRED